MQSAAPPQALTEPTQGRLALKAADDWLILSLLCNIIWFFFLFFLHNLTRFDFSEKLLVTKRTSVTDLKMNVEDLLLLYFSTTVIPLPLLLLLLLPEPESPPPDFSERIHFLPSHRRTL